MSSGASPAALELRRVSRTFGAVRALRGVSFSVNPGEVVGLVGDNGAGKSTLLNIISGALEPSSGELLVDGIVRRHQNPFDARSAGIETVYQNLALIPTLDIAENVYLTREAFIPHPVLRRLRVMNKRHMRRELDRQLAELELSLPSPRTKVAALSGGQRQLVAIARAVLWGSHIVLLDEPTAALGVQQTEVVLSFIERLRGRGLAVVFVSHNMDHVLRVSDRVVVLRLGRKVLDTVSANADTNQLVSAITGLER